MDERSRERMERGKRRGPGQSRETPDSKEEKGKKASAGKPGLEKRVPSRGPDDEDGEKTFGWGSEHGGGFCRS